MLMQWWRWAVPCRRFVPSYKSPSGQPLLFISNEYR